MLGQFGNLISAIIAVKDALKIASGQKGQTTKRGFQRKVVAFQFLLLELIENSDKIFKLISEYSNSENKHETIESIQYLTYSQSHTIHKTIQLVEDEEVYPVIELLKPATRRIVLNQLHSKSTRTGLVLRLVNLEEHEIQELYTEEYSQKGIAIIDKLKACSEEIAALIRENMTFEDLISLNFKTEQRAF